MSYTIGIDFGTESARVVLVDCADGTEVGTRVYEYANGVIDERLPAPDAAIELEPDWALQDPRDYVRALREIPALLADTGVAPEEVVGVATDFTSCTVLPTLADGTPLCTLDELSCEPHAWVKLWKHHAAQPEADLINAVAEERGEPWLARYGGRYSSEWFFSKALQMLNAAPEVYGRAERLIEAADWIVWQLTGSETRSTCAAGYKAMWSKRDGFPAAEFFAALDPRFARVVDEKLSPALLSPVGTRAGGVSARAAAWTGLVPGTPVAVGNIDAHVSAPAVGVTDAGALVAIMGTSTCHILLGEKLAYVDGMSGVVEDGVVPGFYGYEAGQSAVGDIFAWFIENAVPGSVRDAAARRGVSVHDVLADAAAMLRPGETGLLALDWWNGNRSVLVDANLRGLLVGMTLATRPEEIYRALIEATAFGTRIIIEAFAQAGIAIDVIVGCGGLPERNPLLMQIYADVIGRRHMVAASTQAPALGSAMHAAVAAGVYSSIAHASRHMAGKRKTVYEPNPASRQIYDELYREYVRLHDAFGRGANDVMRRLKEIQLAQSKAARAANVG
jgi:L-ribulokinase